MIKLKTNPYRLFIQLAFFGLLIYLSLRIYFDKNFFADFEAYCPYGGIQALSSYLVNNSLACSMTSAQIAMGGMLVLAIVLFSKLFCSFICPIGSFSEWLGKFGEKLKIRYTINGIADKILRSLKYILLFITFYFTITSSELFCKQFDPYYAIVSGYNSDVSVVWATIAIGIVIFGSFYIRLFWCKYICPFGALSNVFRYFLVFIGITSIYLILVFLGVSLSFIWLLGALCLAGFGLELWSLESKTFPIFRITRNTSTCTNCKLCTKVCPQAIDVASMESVKHIDCNLCADCVYVCPEKDTLLINKKGKKWLPAVVLVILIIAGIFAGKSFEIPTINEYWGDLNVKNEMSIYNRSGLKNIKCFGSSTTFANQMRKVNGITGVATFVGTHSVRVLYDPKIIDTIGIQKSFFVPVKVLLTDSSVINENIAVYELQVDQFFDPYDTDYLTVLLNQNKDIYGFHSEFDCPIKVTVFVSSKSNLSSRELKDLIEQKEVNIIYTDGTSQLIDLNYKVKSIRKVDDLISKKDFFEIR